MKNKWLFISIVLLSLFMSSCAAKSGWYKKTVSKEDTKTAEAKCKYEVGINKVTQVEQGDLIIACMEGQGYRWHGK